MIKQYNTHLLQLGVTLETRIHSTYFKTGYLPSLKIYQLITRRKFEDLSANNKKKEVILVFNQDIGEAIATAVQMSGVDFKQLNSK